MDWQKIFEEIRKRLIERKLGLGDVLLAQEIHDNAPGIWKQYTWLRALGGWTAEVDEYAIDFLTREMEAE